MSGRQAVVLLSGGLDSSTVLAIAKSQGFERGALSFQYGQRHKIEVDRAREIGKRVGVTRHVVVDFDLRQFGGSALTSDITVQRTTRSATQMSQGIPITYVPARNTIFLEFRVAWA